MSQMKNHLLELLENNPAFAEHYWRMQDQDYQRPLLPDDGNQWNLSQPIPTNLNSGKDYEKPPF